MAVRRSSIVPYLLVPLLACGGGKKTPPTGDDNPPGDDQPAIDAPAEVTCSVDPSYTYTATANAFAASDGSGSGGSDFDPHNELFQDALNDDATPDVIDVELYAFAGTYTGDIVPGTVDLSAGAEANYATCGACVLLFGDVDPDAGEAQDFFATSGTINVQDSGTTGSDGITTGTFTVTLTNVTLEHVTIDPDDFTSTLVGDDCQTTIANATLTATIEDANGSGAFAPQKHSKFQRPGKVLHARGHRTR